MNEIEIKKKSIISTMQYGLPEIRKALGLSQTDLATLLGKSRQGISLIERGELEMGWETCLAVTAVVLARKPKLFEEKYGQLFQDDLMAVLNS